MNDAVKKIVEDLKQTRDELNLQAHLFKAEAKDKWEETEKKWDTFNDTLSKADTVIDKSSEQVSAAMDLLADEIKKGYNGVKEVLKKIN